jgi:hypothetical protein
VVVKNVDEACVMSDRLAVEHVELHVQDAMVRANRTFLIPNPTPSPPPPPPTPPISSLVYPGAEPATHSKRVLPP